MPMDLFMYGEEEYLELYMKAYYEDMKLHSWLEGQFNYIAYSAAISQVFGKKGEYPSYQEIESKEVKKSSYTEEEARDIISSCY